ncbi:hypothetical protein KIN20_002543 [Parelaphostrongylus tenuis]|uniref:Uncharacterized protein n=1 Tax=Parelaphostrongylus tenuis TaxID=148309 RepID=A0AAD5LXX7_PARTN|nr:hypothetical protein KIN20_002543 [Parelaphostrongylus tenuis]
MSSTSSTVHRHRNVMKQHIRADLKRSVFLPVRAERVWLVGFLDSCFIVEEPERKEGEKHRSSE